MLPEVFKVLLHHPLKALSVSGWAILWILLSASFLSASRSHDVDKGSVRSDQRLTPHHKLYDVLFLNETRGWIVGSLGLILATQDGGGTWQRQDAGTKETLFCLSFVDEATGWVSGANGTILHTTNAGTAWKQQRSGTANQLFAIRFLNFREGFAVGSFGTFLRTRDGGRGWEAVTLPWNILLAERIAREGLPVGRRGYLEPHLYDIFFADGTQGWMVGEFGLVLHTRDGGETWSVQPSHTSQALFQAFFASEREGWVIGQNGLLLYTNDGGENWENLQTGIAGSLFNLAFRGRFGLIVGERGTILTSVDGGASWQRLSPNPGRSRSWLQGVSFIGGNRFAIVGDRGTILLLDLRR